jgi:hypothetical protein
MQSFDTTRLKQNFRRRCCDAQTHRIGFCLINTVDDMASGRPFFSKQALELSQASLVVPVCVISEERCAQGR